MNPTFSSRVWSDICSIFLKPTNGTFSLVKAVNLGDDTDTVGAIAGGLAGLYYEYENIPTEWLSVIKRRMWIEDMCVQIKKCIGGMQDVW